VLIFIGAFALTVGTGGRLSSALGIGGKVAVVEVSGIISDSQDVVDALAGFEHAPSVKAIVVRTRARRRCAHRHRNRTTRSPSLPAISRRRIAGSRGRGGERTASACDAIVANRNATG
jgi:hypothetical protein